MNEDLTQNLPQEGQETEGLNLDNTDVKKLMEQYGLTEEDLNSFLQEELSTEDAEEEKFVPTQETKPETQEKKFAGIFNSVDELEKAYKELQAEYTRQRQRTKKFESFIDLLEQNPQYADYIVEKTKEFFFKEGKTSKKEYETDEYEDLFNEEETENVKKFALNREDILNLVRQEVNQALAAQRLIDDFRRKYPEVTDEELLKIINHARQFGGDLETSYMVLYKDRFKERLLRQALEEMKKGISPQRPGARVETTPKRELTEDDYFQLAREIIAGKRRLDELDPDERAKLLNIIARQLIVM
jgi:ParB-like chromosome segregation protein Spo0J